MRSFFKKHIQGKKVLIIFLITNIVYLFMLLVTIPLVMTYSNGMDLFDMMPAGYSEEYAQTLLSTLGTEGRNSYLYIQLPVDMIYPFLFGLTYSLLLAYFLDKLKWIDKPVFYSTLLPLAAGMFDYLENAGIVIMLNQYPDITSITARFANACTIIKSALSTISFSLLLILIVIFFIQKIKSRKPEMGI
jgi:hypothetical protein